MVWICLMFCFYRYCYHIVTMGTNTTYCRKELRACCVCERETSYIVFMMRGSICIFWAMDNIVNDFQDDDVWDGPKHHSEPR